MFMATWISRRAIVIATSLSSSPVTVRSRKSKWRAKPIELAKESAQQKGREDRTAHVGFYLIDQGLPRLERASGARWRWKGFVRTKFSQVSFHLLCRRNFSVHALGHARICAGGGGARRRRMAARILRVHIFARCQSAGGGVDGTGSPLCCLSRNCCRVWGIRPAVLSRRAAAWSSFPQSSRSAEGIDHLLQTLEIHHLANRDPHLHFALLTDWPDAAEENLPEDGPLLERAKAGIESLNRKYAGGRRDLFFLFHRPRRWNESEGVWMGYERKRGKLVQFNAFLRGRCAECFAAAVGD